MSLGAQQGAETSAVDGAEYLLTHARFELMPFDSFEDEIQHLPDGASIAITTSPKLGIEKTVERSEEAAAQAAAEEEEARRAAEEAAAAEEAEALKEAEADIEAQKSAEESGETPENKEGE